MSQFGSSYTIFHAPCLHLQIQASLFVRDLSRFRLYDMSSLSASILMHLIFYFQCIESSVALDHGDLLP